MIDLDKMKLPKRSINEELEQLSKDKLRPLFENSLYEFREEVYRDKGLDLIIELKYKESYTNFRFQVQLKSTDTKIPNSDGSYSWQIDTSNIQYLLNGGLPTYYICYIKKTDKFYFQNINDFVNKISDEKIDWNKQDSHTLRISEILNKESISDIYNDVKNICENKRIIREKIHFPKNKTTKVSITKDYTITDEGSILKTIEENGLFLINEGRSKDLVLLSLKVSSNITSSLYNAIVGIAYYYTSNLFDAISSFQKALRDKNVLSKELLEHIYFYDAITKYSIGYINQQEYFKILESLVGSKDIGSYAKIENAKNKYSDLSDNSFEKIKNIYFDIINDNKTSQNVRFMTNSEYVYYWSRKINMDYFISAMRINTHGSKSELSSNIYNKPLLEFSYNHEKWAEYNKKLTDTIIEKKDFIAFNMCKLYEMKSGFEFILYNYIVRFDNNSINKEAKSLIDIILKGLETIINNYRSQYHISNLIFALSIKYEVLLFIEKNDKANEILDEMYKLVEFHDLKEQKRKIDYLANGGTTKETLSTLFNKINNNANQEQNEYLALVEEMKFLDEEDKKKKDVKPDSELLVFELFPISHFSVPIERIDEFYKILKIDSYKLIKQFNAFNDTDFVPVLNIFNDITEEGYVNGNLDDKGIESWRRIRDIRVELYEKDFKRIQFN